MQALVGTRSYYDPRSKKIREESPNEVVFRLSKFGNLVPLQAHRTECAVVRHSSGRALVREEWTRAARPYWPDGQFANSCVPIAHPSRTRMFRGRALGGESSVPGARLAGDRRGLFLARWRVGHRMFWGAGKGKYPLKSIRFNVRAFQALEVHDGISHEKCRFWAQGFFLRRE